MDSISEALETYLHVIKEKYQTSIHSHSLEPWTMCLGVIQYMIKGPLDEANL
mgnify:CR=1 FL=1